MSLSDNRGTFMSLDETYRNWTRICWTCAAKFRLSPGEKPYPMCPSCRGDRK